jgi:hypothetical protein
VADAVLAGDRPAVFEAQLEDARRNRLRLLGFAARLVEENQRVPVGSASAAI